MLRKAQCVSKTQTAVESYVWALVLVKTRMTSTLMYGSVKDLYDSSSLMYGSVSEDSYELC